MTRSKIMIVEDETLVALDLKTKLEELDYEVTAMVASGDEALQSAAAVPPDLALMDIHLKGKEDGIDTAARLRADFGIPVIYLTAYSDDAILDRAIKTAPYGYLIKPYKERELRAVVETGVGKRAMERALEQTHTQLEQQLRFLRRLYTLRNTLSNVPHTTQVIAQVGHALLDMDSSVIQVEIAYSQRTWSFGDQPVTTGHCFRRCLSWNNRAHGRLSIFCNRPLSELEERMLLDETAGLLEQVLEARELNARLLHSARLVSLGQMSAGVAHELNQPLMAISTTAEDVYLRVLEQIDLPSDQLKEMMQDVLDMVERMGDIIDHMRVFSRDEASEPSTQTSFTLDQVIEQALALLRAQLRNHGIELVLELSNGLPPLQGHAHQLEQVLLNLLTNARDALDTGGKEPKKLTIRTVREGDAESWVTLEVEDNGIGMDEEIQSHLFEPFFSTKPENRGAGLGLSVTHAIVEDFGGRIDCRSNPDTGTTFTIHLPTAPREQPNTPASTAHGPITGNERR